MIRHTRAERLLGNQLTACGQVKTTLQNKRATTAKDTMTKKIRWLPLDGDAIAAASSTVSLKQFGFGLAYAKPADYKVKALTSAITSAIAGKDNTWRNAATIYTITHKGHAVHPWQVLHQEPILMARKQIAKHPELRRLFEETWAPQQPATSGQDSAIMMRLRQTAVFLGAAWTSPLSFTLPTGLSFDIVGGPNGWWRHEMRQALREAVNRQATFRSDNSGQHDGINYAITTRNLRSKRFGQLYTRPQLLRYQKVVYGGTPNY